MGIVNAYIVHWIYDHVSREDGVNQCRGVWRHTTGYYLDGWLSTERSTIYVCIFYVYSHHHD